VLNSVAAIANDDDCSLGLHQKRSKNNALPDKCVPLMFF